MNFYQIFMFVLALFFVLGTLDRCFGNRLGLGIEFEKGFALMGSIALSIIGLISISPVLANILEPFVVPLFNFIGADPAMFPPIFLSTDAGGYSIAVELAENAAVGKFGGLIVASMLGGVMSFTIPVAIGLIESRDVKYFAIGIMAGIVSSPVGCFFGGLASGLSPSVILKNLLPVIIFSLLIAVGLLLRPNKMIIAFKLFARFITILIAIGLSLAAFEKLTGIGVIKEMNPISEGILIAGSVVIVIAGVLPFIKVIMYFLDKPLKKIGSIIGVNNVSIVSFFLALTTIVPVFISYKDMNTKGKVLVAAFAGSTANMLGAHLGFISTVSPDMILPMFIAKISAGILALPFAAILAKLIFLDKEDTDTTFFPRNVK